ncbi:hypothetical protein [Leisingera sp. D0M16]|uniref:hypothetical protein n=1 Tax=Leisingera coralii TaxID=3351347 RepID=UPI003B9F4C6F
MTEVMVKVSKPAKTAKHGNPNKVTRGTEARRVAHPDRMTLEPHPAGDLLR